jgi:hypothetical protein
MEYVELNEYGFLSLNSYKESYFTLLKSISLSIREVG